MIVKLLTESHSEFLSKREETQTRLSLHLSKCQIVGNFMPRLSKTSKLACDSSRFTVAYTKKCWLSLINTVVV